MKSSPFFISFGLSLFFVVLLSRPDLCASEKALVEIQSSVGETSDGVRQSKLSSSYRNHRRYPGWKYEGEASDQWDLGGELTTSRGSNLLNRFQVVGVRGQVGRQLSEFQLIDFGLGGIFANDLGTGKIESALVGMAKWSGEVSRSFSFVTTAERASTTFDYLQPERSSLGLLSVKVSVATTYRLAESVKLGFGFAETWINDSNRKTDVQLSTMYGFSTGVPWIWAGFEAGTFSNSDKKAAYWSPTRFSFFGPRIESSFEFWKKSDVWILSGGLSGGISLIKEEQNASGLSYSVTPGLSFGDRNLRLFQLSYGRILSKQGSGEWSQNEVRLSGSFSL